MDLNALNKTNYLSKLKKKNLINIMNLNLKSHNKLNSFYVKNYNIKNIDNSLKNNQINNNIIRLNVNNNKSLKNIRYSLDLKKNNNNDPINYYNIFLKNSNILRNNIKSSSLNKKNMNKNFFGINKNKNNTHLKLYNYNNNSINNIKINSIYVPNNIKSKKFYLTPKKIIKRNNNFLNNNFSLISNYQKYKNNNISHSQIIKIKNEKICPICNKKIELFKYNFHYNLHPSLILPFIYLGSYRNACDKKEINNLNISYVLNCAVECYDHFPKNIKYCHIKLNDLPYFNILPFLNTATDFIEEARKNNKNILVHCQLGISRSTSCVIAYMIKYMNYNCFDALEFIKKKRKLAMPNNGFIEQLITFQKNLSLN